MEVLESTTTVDPSAPVAVAKPNTKTSGEMELESMTSAYYAKKAAQKPKIMMEVLESSSFAEDGSEVKDGTRAFFK